MKAENTQPVDSNLQQGVNEGLREKLELANKDMATIKTLNNTTRDLVSKDVNDLLMTENKTEIFEALIVIGHKSKIQPIYQTDLRESAPDIAKAAAEALSKYQLTLIEPALEKGLEVIDSKEAVSIANQHRKREKINLGLNIEGQRLNESENLRHANSPQENIIAFNDRTQEKPVTSNQPAEQADEKQSDSTAKQAINQDMPETVSNRYLRIKDKYYFQDKTMAFEDRGNKLKLETENHTVIKDALVIAETRNWQSITVSGSDNFKHQVWREASLKGIEVAGYKPSQLEEAELSKALALQKVKEIGANPKKQGEKAEQQQDDAIRGTLLAHGADHYKHDPEQGKSYYVKLDVKGKEVTHWGTDFKRAFADSQSQPQVGDTVVLNNTGKRNVDIPTTGRDADGNLVEDKKAVKKNTWRVEKTDYHDTLQDQAEALRVGKEIEHKVIEQMPQLAAALAVSKLGEKIAQQAKESGALKSQDEVDTMVSLIREGLAAALKDGKHIKTPEIQEQGKRAAINANNIINDQIPPEIVKEPQQQDMAMTR